MQRRIRLTSTKQRTAVSYVTTQLAEFLTKTINLKGGSERCGKEENKGEQPSPKKNNTLRPRTAEGDLRVKSRDQDPLQTRQLGEILSIDEILKENKKAKSTFNAFGVPKKQQNWHNILQIFVKSLVLYPNHKRGTPERRSKEAAKK